MAGGRGGGGVSQRTRTNMSGMILLSQRYLFAQAKGRRCRQDLDHDGHVLLRPATAGRWTGR